jgi:hypothetical protein
MNRGKRIAFMAIIVIVPIALVVAATEACLRWMGLGDPLLYEYDLGYGYRLQPNQKAVRLRGAMVTVNAAGLRSSGQWRPDAPRRFLFIGDSITYGGSYIDDRQLFSELVCGHFTDAVCGNAGGNAYGTDNMARRLRTELVRLKPTAVVATLYYGDTLRGQAGLKAQPVFSKPLFWLVPAIEEAFAFVIDEVRSKIRYAPVSAYDAVLDDEVAAEASRSLGELFGAMRLAQDQGVKVLLVYSATHDEVAKGRKPGSVGAFVFDKMVQSGLPLLDTLPLLSGRDLGPIYYDDVHFEAPGHRLYADAIAARLARD